LNKALSRRLSQTVPTVNTRTIPNRHIQRSAFKQRYKMLLLHSRHPTPFELTFFR
jgi:hypothetical protein